MPLRLPLRLPTGLGDRFGVRECDAERGETERRGDLEGCEFEYERLSTECDRVRERPREGLRDRVGERDRDRVGERECLSDMVVEEALRYAAVSFARRL